jgi:hypothetical protein
MADDKIILPILFGDKEELYTVMASPEQYKRIKDGGKFWRCYSFNLQKV